MFAKVGILRCMILTGNPFLDITCRAAEVISGLILNAARRLNDYNAFPHPDIIAPLPMVFFSLLFLLGIGAIGYLAVSVSLIAPLPFSPFIFPATFSVAALALIFLAPSLEPFLSTPADERKPARSWKQRLVKWLDNHLLYIIVIPAALALILLPSLQFGYHGLFHSGYTYQILLRGVPPENVTLPGYPANDYWPYHVYLALLTRLFDSPPPFVSAISNVILMGMSFLWTAGLWKRLTRDNAAPPAFYVIFPLLGSNLFYALNTQIVNWIAALPQAARWLDFLRAADIRLDIPLIRFVNFNGFSVGIVFFLATLYMADRLLKSERLARDFWLLAGLGAGALLYHATTGVFLFAVVAPALAASLLMDNNSKPLFAKEDWPVIAKHVPLAILFFLPVAMFLLRSAGAMGVKTGFELFSWRDVSSIFVVAYPVAIFFFPEMLRAWKEKDLPVIFLCIVALWGFLLAIFIQLPDGNEYKFIYLSSIAFLLVASLRIRAIVSQPGFWRKGLFAFLMAALIYHTAVGTRFFYDTYRRRHAIGIAYQGMHVTIEETDFAPFAWIRENTPPETVIIQPQNSKDWNYGYFSERLPYVVGGHIYNEGIPETAIRWDQVGRLYDTALPVRERIAIVQEIIHSLDRPIALIYPTDDAFQAAMQTTFGVTVKQMGKAAVIYLLRMP